MNLLLMRLLRDEQQKQPGLPLPGVKPSLAAKLMRLGYLTISRSFRLHRRRGGFCHRGWCTQCKTRLVDGKNVLACQTTDTDPVSIVRPAPFYRWLAVWTERLTPYFYHKRFLKPAILRQFYLGVIRRLSAALPLDSSIAKKEHRTWEDLTCDTLVVGGGLAGMQAACVASKKDKQVILVEAEELGGSARYLSSMTVSVQSLIQELIKTNVQPLTELLCVGLYESATQALCIGEDNNKLIHFKELIIATGAYDRMLTLKGNDLPGIVGIRGFEKLVAEGAISPHWEIGVYGWFEEVERLLRCRKSHDICITWIGGPGQLPKTDSHTYPDLRIDKLNGHSKVSSVNFEDGQQASCDLLVFAFTQPSYELQMHAGQKAAVKTELPIVVPTGEALIPMVVVGEAAGAIDLNDARKHAEETLKQWYEGTITNTVYRDHPTPINSMHPDSFICHCEDVRVADVFHTIDDGFTSIELIKRRTGAGTGPCQGKFCHAQFVACAASKGVTIALPTMRPFARPTPLYKFLGRSDV